MAQITNVSRLKAVTNNGDTSPRFEAIVGQNVIASIWVYSTAEDIVFEVQFHKQFIGVMHAGTDNAEFWTEEAPGWLEDGNARKGDLIEDAYFEEFTEALDHLMERSKHHMTEAYGGLTKDKLAV